MKVNAWLEKVAGYGTCTGVSILVDDIAWPIVIAWLGPWNGGIAMTLIALVINLFLIWVYDTLKKDFLGFEKIREIQESEIKGFWMWMIHKALRLGKVPTFIALSYYDPFMAVIFMRKGINSYRMTGSDWLFFALAMTIACVGFTAFWSGVIWAIKAI